MKKGNYCTILESEFDTLLKNEKGWKKNESYGELVYTYDFKKYKNLQFKVFSSISKNDGISRKCGGDAIRLCVINIQTKKGVRKTKRINRVPGWESRIKERFIEISQSLND